MRTPRVWPTRFGRFSGSESAPVIQTAALIRGGRSFRALAGKLKQKRIVVSLQAQELYALEDGRCIMQYDCVTGDGDHPTSASSSPSFH